MKALIFLFILLTPATYGQVIDQMDIRQRPGEALPLLFYQQDFSTLDLSRPEDMAAIEIFQFDLGTVHHKYNLKVFSEHYRDGKLVDSDTLFNVPNTYSYFLEGKYRKGFFNQIKIFTLHKNNHCSLDIRTYARSTQQEISLDPAGGERGFYLMPFQETQWKLNRKVALLIFASDSTEHDSEYRPVMEEVLRNSPEYFLITYMLSETEE